jgi:hypothetical protein
MNPASELQCSPDALDLCDYSEILLARQALGSTVSAGRRRPGLLQTGSAAAPQELAIREGLELGRRRIWF